jgi:outer membrane protein OmpA-like peptidoglycan-associated protein
VVWFLWLACAARPTSPTAPTPRPVALAPDAAPPPRLPDRDGDGIPDARDQCPDAAENVNGCRDDDGCPDQIVVIPPIRRVAILDQIFFAAGSAKLRTGEPPHVDPLVDAVATTLKMNPELGPIEVRGHAALDERSAASLADRRAAAVAAALVARGIARERLVVHGVGATSPVCARRDEACQSQNRRVEFVVTKQPAPPPPPPHGPHDCIKVLV